MNIQADISWIKSELTKVEDPELIMVFKSLLKYRAKHLKTDWWDEISHEEKDDILASVEEINNGETINHDKVMANPREWS